MSTCTVLREALAARLAPPQAAWLEQALAGVAGADEAGAENVLLTFSAMAGRKLGTALLGEGAELPFEGGHLPAAHWTLAEAGRVLLMQAACAAHPGLDAALVGAVFRLGDEAEAGAALRGLALLPGPARFKFYALEAGRTNSKVLYACLLQHNPYPAAFYSDHEFNQLVLKALFLGLPITAVTGLADRANPELSRMCEDYVDERLAAFRSLPTDIWLALGPCASAHGLELLQAYAHSEDPEHRRHAALALAGRPS